MGSVHSRVELLGFDAVYRKFSRAPSTVQAEAIKAIQDEATPMLSAMHAAAHTRIQKHAANSVAIRKDKLGVELAGAAAGSSLDRTLFMGGEFGGRKSRKVTYATRSPRGRAYLVSRRTTMQFLPYLRAPSGRGGAGYFFYPTVRVWLPKINKSIGERVAEVLR